MLDNELLEFVQISLKSILIHNRSRVPEFWPTAYYYLQALTGGGFLY